MRIFVINLDRHRQRWRRMEALLHGTNFKRIAAVDGRTVEGAEWREPASAMCYEALSRYERACILSHRAAAQAFLAAGDPYCCVLEDDVFISPDFFRFVHEETWIPKNCDLLKIETTRYEVFLSRKTAVCLDRNAARLLSAHFGTAAYIISRRGAEILLDATVRPDRPLDYLMFDEEGLKKFQPVWQMIPAPCIQATPLTAGLICSEMESSIQPKMDKKPPIIPVQPRKTLANKIKRETFRPFRQLKSRAQSLSERFKGIRRCRVPFA
jgi:glycosyl transferase, family 25